MLARALGIALVFCFWNEFYTVQGQTASQVCEYDRNCAVAYVVTTCQWWGQCFQQVVIVNSICRTHDTCVAESGTNPAWGTCTATCNPGGTRSRVNTCNRASSTANTCTYSETESCNNIPCAGVDVNGNWGLWGQWTGTSACSRTCCEGTQSQTRTRVCDNPPPSGNGMTCAGSGTETRAAGPCGSNDNQCPLACPDTTTTFADTCRRCVSTYYSCATGTATLTNVCTDPGEVWTQAIGSCASPAVCNALEPPLS